MNRSRPAFVTLALGASMLLLESIAVTPTWAETIVYHFTGNVTQIQHQLEPLFGKNPSAISMAGSMTVNATDTTPLDTHTGIYTVINFSVTIGGHTYTHAGPVLGIQIQNGLPGPDSFTLTVPPTISGDDIPGRSHIIPQDFSMGLQTLGNTSVFTDDTLPTLVPSLSSFKHNDWRLNFAPGDKQVSGTITSLSATVVPLPASLILFGAGLAALVGLGSRGWRQKRPNLQSVRS